MTSFPCVAFYTAQISHAVVLVCAQALIDADIVLGAVFRAVVAGEDEQGIVCLASSLQGIHNLADDPIDLADKVSIAATAALALKSGVGHDG